MKTKYIAVVSLFILITGVSTTTAALSLPCPGGSCTVSSPTPSSSSNTTPSPAPSPSLENRVATLEANNYNLSAKLTALESANQSLSARIDALEADNRLLHSQINALLTPASTTSASVPIINSIPSLTSTSVSTPELANNQVADILGGALIRAKGESDVYIVKYVGNKKFKRLVLSPAVFKNYGHLKWENVMDVDKSVVDSFTTSDLVRVAGDSRLYQLYPSGDTGQKRLVKDSTILAKYGFDPDSVYEINSFDRDSYITGAILE